MTFSVEPRPMRRFFNTLALLVFVAANSCIAQVETLPGIEQVLAQITPRESAAPISQDPRWKKPKKIHVMLPAAYRPNQTGDFQAWLSAGLDAELVLAGSLEELDQHAGDIEVLVGWCNFLPGQYPRLRWLQSLSAGVEVCAKNDQFNRPGVLVSNGSGTAAPAIAEWVITSMLMMQRRFLDYYQAQQSKQWQATFEAVSPGREINGKTLLIVGLGSIGKQVAWRAKGLGMKVTAIRNRSRSGPEYVDYIGLGDELPALTRQADVVVNAAPLTEKTRGMFDREFFGNMKSDAMFINVGRGGSVVQEALIEALKSGAIGAAALDVTTPEPLPEDSELWTLPNVFITPHRSANTRETSLRIWVFLKENIRRYIEGEKIFNLVDLQRGY